MSNGLKQIGNFLIKNMPTILTATGIAGMATTMIFVAKGTPKAAKNIEIMKEEYAEEGREVKGKDIVKAAAPAYIPAAITFVAATACIIGSLGVGNRRNATLTTLYSLSETAMKDYMEKTKELVGEKKEQEIKEAIVNDRIERHPAKNEDIIVTGNGDTLCYDPMSSRYFRSDANKIKAVENDLNRRIINGEPVSLNDLYYELGLGLTSIGEDLGWPAHDGNINIKFRSKLSDNDIPVLVMNLEQGPVYEYYYN